jgi:hypothetical protein
MTPNSLDLDDDDAGFLCVAIERAFAFRSGMP